MPSWRPWWRAPRSPVLNCGVDTVSSNFKSRLAAREQLLGTFVKTPSPILCEVLGKTELDVICLDAEHAPFDRLVQDQCLYALRSQGKDSLVQSLMNLQSTNLQLTIFQNPLSL